jgi:hypothetical protein
MCEIYSYIMNYDIIPAPAQCPAYERTNGDLIEMDKELIY